MKYGVGTGRDAEKERTKKKDPEKKKSRRPPLWLQANCLSHEQQALLHNLEKIILFRCRLTKKGVKSMIDLDLEDIPPKELERFFGVPRVYCGRKYR